MKKTSQKKNAKKFSLLSTALFIAFSYLIFEFVRVQIQIRDRNNEIISIKSQIQEQTLKNTELERTLSMGDNKDYIEQVSRERYGLVYPNEMIFFDMGGE